MEGSSENIEKPKSPEVSREMLKRAMGNEEREKIELQQLAREYREVQMQLMEKQESYDRGIQSIDIAPNTEDAQAEALRQGLINFGRKLKGEIDALTERKKELESDIEAKDGNPKDYTVQ